MTKNKTGQDKGKRWSKRVGNHLGVLMLKGISLLPFWAIYGISDVFYLLIRYVIRYRFDVTTDNLKHAFPEKSEKEINQLRNRFYRHFCDFTLESVKLHSMSEKSMRKRLKFKGIDIADDHFEAGRGVVVLAFHHNNWEWCSSLQKYVKARLLMVYSPIRNNDPMENFLKHSRTRWGGEVVPMRRAPRVAFEYAGKKEPAALWLAADQSAPPNSQFWTVFMNREAPFFSGPEKIAIKTKQPIFFQHVRKLGRGKYEVEFSKLIEDPTAVEPKEILLTYIRKMEEIIREEPEYYLWSHRRWKHSRPEGIELTF